MFFNFEPALNTDTEASTSYESPDTVITTGQTWTKQNESTASTVKRGLKKVCIAILGIFLGFVTLAPNAMMLDSPSNSSAAFIGVCASLSFVIGGVYGGFVGKFVWLLPGLVLQVIALALLPWS